MQHSFVLRAACTFRNCLLYKAMEYYLIGNCFFRSAVSSSVRSIPLPKVMSGRQDREWQLTDPSEDQINFEFALI